MTTNNMFRDTTTAGPVTCLGQTFASDTARREHYSALLREKLKDPAFRAIEGFPHGADDDIIALSDPPYYTACPNPWLADFVQQTKSDSQSDVNTPYAGDLDSNDRHPVYSFHPYHTKVPPSIISELIKFYTNTNDLVFDPFCGSGMTGVAARDVNRNVILNDLSPIACFISAVNVETFKLSEFQTEVNRIISDSKKQWGWVYQTLEHKKLMEVNYFVWSDVFVCPDCVAEFPFFPHAVIHHGNKVETKSQFNCPWCQTNLNVRKIERIITANGKKKKLVWVNAGTGKGRVNREVTEYDLEIIAKIQDISSKTSTWFPKNLIDPDRYAAKLAQLGNKGLTDVSKFLSDRNLIIFADLWDRMLTIHSPSTRNAIRACLTSIYTVISERQGYFGGGGGMSGNLYMPIVRMEKNIYDSLERKIKKFIESEKSKPANHTGHLVTNQSATSLISMGNNSIDYIYTDPPFGSNIMYGEMNLLLESWLKITTEEAPEAVIDETRKRGSEEYHKLMTTAFKECYRVLKPGKWITVEFHNTRAAIWNIIQSALSESGFIVAQVAKLDKGSTTILADIRPGAVVQDLLISAYKPTNEFDNLFKEDSLKVDNIWQFIKNHLNYLPIYKQTIDGMQFITERDPRILYDQVIAYYIRKGLPVPIDSSAFHLGLSQRFVDRDGMYFLSDQVITYDRAVQQSGAVVQTSMFVSDESSAIHWLRQVLKRKPQTFADINPEFMQQLGGWSKNETQLDLRVLLEQNFLSYAGDDAVPDQIHAYLSSNYPDLRNKADTDPALRAKAKDRWYVPDPNKAQDLEQVRERALLREYDGYVAQTGKLRVFRLEAIRAGFKRAYQQQHYKNIVAMAKRLPTAVIEEDEKLLMWVDNATMRIGE